MSDVMMKALQLQVESLTRQVERLGPENERVRKLLTEFDQRHDTDQNQIAALSAALEAERANNNTNSEMADIWARKLDAAEARLKEAVEVATRLADWIEHEAGCELPFDARAFLASIGDKP